MYQYPYGDGQQLNLNWIINEIIQLRKQLDPDYTEPSFSQIYPFSNTEQLNLDWILAELKALKELAPEPEVPVGDIDEIGQALVAGAYDSTKNYQKNDYIVQDGKVLRAKEATTGAFDPSMWQEVVLGDDLAIISRWASAMDAYINALKASEVTNDSSVEGATVKDALETLKNAVPDLPEMSTDNVTNESSVEGTTATAALNNLKGAITNKMFIKSGTISSAHTSTETTTLATDTAKINANTDIANVWFSEPSLITSGYTVATNASGQVTINCTNSAQVTVYVVLFNP